MIVDFITANLRQRRLYGQPLVIKAVEGHYAECSRLFELHSLASHPEQFTTTGITLISREETQKPPVLFIRPKPQTLPDSLRNRYQVTQIDERSSDLPYLKDGVLHMPVVYWHHLVWKAVSTEGDESLVWTQRLLDELVEYLQALGPKLILFRHDAHYLERAVAVVAKALDIPTVTIQDGVFSPKFEPSLQIGDASDHLIVWSEHTKRFLQKSHYVPSNRIHVLAYPYTVAPFAPVKKGTPGSRTVVFLGQPFESFNQELAARKERLAAQTLEVCRRLGLPFRYRPHPAELPESVSRIVPHQMVLSSTQPLDDVFRDNAVFVSLTSTALIEAGLYGRVAIQIYEEAFEFEDLGQVGVCYRSGPTRESIYSLLEKFKRGDLTPMPVNPDYLPVTNDLHGKFESIVEAIIEGSELGGDSIKGNVCCVVGSNTAGLQYLSHLIPPGSSDIEPATHQASKLLDGIRALSPLPGTRAMIPAHLDLEEVFSRLADWRSRSDDVVVHGEVACFSLGYFLKTRHIQRIVIVIEPPIASELAWMMRLATAFRGIGSAPVSIFFAGIGNETPAEPVDLLYFFLRSRLEGVSEPSDSTLQECQTAIENALETILVKQRTEAELISKQKRIMECVEDANGLSAQLDRIRASLFWRVGSKVRRVLLRKRRAG